MNAHIIPLPGSTPEPQQVPMHPADHVELAKLRGFMAQLERPLIEMLTELAELRVVRYEAIKAMEKVAEHERKGWSRIALGAFDPLRKALDRRP